MAFGSGSFSATDRWMRRRGLPSSLQPLKVGNATLLHQHSSSKPTAQVSGLAAAIAIRVDRASFFSFIQMIWGGDPPLGPHPSNPEEARKRRSDGLARNLPLGESLLESGPRGHLQSPQARV